MPRLELASWLRQAISEQRRIDASYAGLEPPSMPGAVSSHADNKAIEYDIRLILPEHPVFQRNMNPNKRSTTKKHRASSKVSRLQTRLHGRVELTSRISTLTKPAPFSNPPRPPCRSSASISRPPSCPSYPSIPHGSQRTRRGAA